MSRIAQGAPFRVAWEDTGKTWGDRDGLGTLAVARREAAYCAKWSRGPVVILDKNGNPVPATAPRAILPCEDAPGSPISA